MSDLPPLSGASCTACGWRVGGEGFTDDQIRIAMAQHVRSHDRAPLPAPVPTAPPAAVEAIDERSGLRWRAQRFPTFVLLEAEPVNGVSLRFWLTRATARELAVILEAAGGGA